MNHTSLPPVGRRQVFFISDSCGSFPCVRCLLRQASNWRHFKELRCLSLVLSRETGTGYDCIVQQRGFCEEARGVLQIYPRTQWKASPCPRDANRCKHSWPVQSIHTLLLGNSHQHSTSFIRVFLLEKQATLCLSLPKSQARLTWKWLEKNYRKSQRKIKGEM